ncbi:HAD family hydrolase [Caproiciproducens sp. R2]|uniref:HAD family hydrolase n=1 Tax=Caproiciproducens sp. R2 TaxID=3435187 RepID=UPI004033C15F
MEPKLEIVRLWDKNRFSIRYALFDFDGTVSLIREGWQDIMIPYFCEVLRSTATPESEEAIRKIVLDFVTDLTGKQTIFQCIKLNEEVVKRGGPKREPIVYKKEYLRRLELRIAKRKERLAAGEADPEEWLVPGVGPFLKLLRSNGIKCYLASGTDEEDVLYEAKLLGLQGVFDGGIHGAHDAMVECSKELVINAMLNREHIRPDELISFGDGFVEVKLVAKHGGLAVGVATEESKRRGVNQWKRSRLIAAGARVIIPDFRDTEGIYGIIR